MKELNTFCRKCGEYTENKIVNLQRAQELECRCAVCGKLKDVYSYGETAKEVKNERNGSVFAAVFVLALAAFVISLFSMVNLMYIDAHISVWYKITLAVSLIVLTGCVIYHNPAPVKDGGKH